MSVFAPQRPSEGWQTRWPREAFGLMRQTPHILLVICAVPLSCGFLLEIMPLNTLHLFTYGMMLSGVGCPLIAWAFHQMGKHEAYVEGRFTEYGEPVKISIGTALFVMALMSLLWIGVAQGQTEPADALRLGRVFSGATNIITGAIIFSYAGMFRLLVIPMVNQGQVRNAVLAKQAHNKLREVFPSVSLVCLVVYIVLDRLLPGYVKLPLAILFLYIVYVAGREIIGGITGNRETQSEYRLAETPS